MILHTLCTFLKWDVIANWKADFQSLTSEEYIILTVPYKTLRHMFEWHPAYAVKYTLFCRKQISWLALVLGGVLIHEILFL